MRSLPIIGCSGTNLHGALRRVIRSGFNSVVSGIRQTVCIALLLATASGCQMIQEPTSAVGRGQIAFQSERNGNLDIYVMNADGTGERRLTTNLAEDCCPDWSPDGSLILFTSNRDESPEIYVIHPDGTGLRRVTHNEIREGSPKWDPTGTRIAYHSARDGKVRVYLIDANGDNETGVTGATRDHLSPAWSPDGDWIATESATEDVGFDDVEHPRRNQIWITRIDGSESRQMTEMEAYNGYPAWSPDGSRIAFDCNESGRADDDDAHADVHVLTIDGRSEVNLSRSLGYNEFADWSSDGNRIAFVSSRDGNNEIYTMRADGSMQTRITYNDFDDGWPSWSPF